MREEGLHERAFGRGERIERIADRLVQARGREALRTDLVTQQVAMIEEESLVALELRRIAVADRGESRLCAHEPRQLHRELRTGARIAPGNLRHDEMGRRTRAQLLDQQLLSRARAARQERG